MNSNIKMAIKNDYVNSTHDNGYGRTRNVLLYVVNVYLIRKFKNKLFF